MEKILISLALLIVAFAVVAIRAYSRSIRGVWVQEEGDGWLEILLEQKGLSVSGRCYVEGGHYDYSGFWTGGTVRLDRRDFGAQMLVGKGFPESVVPKLEGTVMARFSLRLTAPDTLNGLFYPQYIKWNKDKTRVELRRFVDPKWRTWLRRESPAAQALIERKLAERQAKEDAERQAGGYGMS